MSSNAWRKTAISRGIGIQIRQAERRCLFAQISDTICNTFYIVFVSGGRILETVSPTSPSHSSSQISLKSKIQKDSPQHATIPRDPVHAQESRKGSAGSLSRQMPKPWGRLWECYLPGGRTYALLERRCLCPRTVSRANISSRFSRHRWFVCSRITACGRQSMSACSGALLSRRLVLASACSCSPGRLRRTSLCRQQSEANSDRQAPDLPQNCRAFCTRDMRRAFPYRCILF